MRETCIHMRTHDRPILPDLQNPVLLSHPNSHPSGVAIQAPSQQEPSRCIQAQKTQKKRTKKQKNKTINTDSCALKLFQSISQGTRACTYTRAL